jgi:hypothetical protein
MFDYHLDPCMLMIRKNLSFICSFFDQFAMPVLKPLPLSELYQQCKLAVSFKYMILKLPVMVAHLTECRIPNYQGC